MAEQVNQRIEEMINELEQMRRTNLFNDEEIKQISVKRKEFEYQLQRRVKQKEDFVHYIAYELALLENISLRRKQAKLGEKKKDIEYAIAKRLNKVFKQFIYRFQNEVEIYFEYIKFCLAVGFEHAVSAIIGQMLQIHGDKPKMWLMASHWESKEQKEFEKARGFLLKGIHRHPESSALYLELFKIELTLAFNAETDEDKEKILKRASIVWRNGIKTVEDESFLFQLCDLSMKFNESSITNEIKEEVWSRRDRKDVWSYIASKELEGCHWEQIEEFADDDNSFSKEVNYCIGVYEEALQQFPDVNLCTKYIHLLLSVSDSICNEAQKTKVLKHAWNYGHENGLLSNDMYKFGIEMLKLENETSNEELLQILDSALTKNPRSRILWEEKIILNKTNDKVMLNILQDAAKVLKPDDNVFLWNLMLDIVQNESALKNVYKKFQNCDSAVLLSIKPKLLRKLNEHSNIKAVRDLYEEFIRTPPTQVEVHQVMIDIEKSQDKVSLKNIRKCYECLIQHHGAENVDLWNEYIQFEIDNGNAQASPAIYRRAVATLKKDLVDRFIKIQTLAKIK